MENEAWGSRHERYARLGVVVPAMTSSVENAASLSLPVESDECVGRADRAN
jgi:hypothetical protein